MNFNAIEELKTIVTDIEGKLPTDLLEYFEVKVPFLAENGITENMHIGKSDWTLTTASEWLLSMFIGIIQKGKEDERNYNAFGSWLQHVYHFVIENKNNLPD